MKFASPTQFSDSVQKRESNGTSCHLLLPISVVCGKQILYKSMKRILLRVTKSAVMNIEELTTLVTQIEAVLNSHPLSPLSSDTHDFNPLTPGHFLTGNAILSFPEPSTASDSLFCHSRWKLIQALRNKFWNRWSTEYLSHLQTRAKTQT
ncbi:integrase catalytic domain-containing protein [Trichonephila clavata]|uniref:Integrase catalytic domain-containing protein n=1 Tax=Trichonephila clavata TaxID=2740835 RepID=A0A8X6GL34_TRICU|nr:integrase catalytic domain-containing protein [Trichonephila clavata]